MISVSEALHIVQSNIEALESQTLSVKDALDQVIATDVHSPIDMPPFPQSAMDGYAVSSNASSFELVAEIQAGDDASSIHLNEGEAVRIFTGAMVPAGTFAVAKQEIVKQEGTTISILEVQKPAQNIRPQGEQIEQGEIALKKGAKINAGVAGFLYTLGINSIEVVRRPKVTIIATGNELIPPGEPLTPGKIYESNTYMIQAALEKMGIQAAIKTVQDDYESTREIIKSSIDESDLLITTGGISVGDYDFVGKAMNEIGVESLFYKVKQKPGKPLYFGKDESTIVFGLPGNPAAALSCFYIYVTPAIHKMSGFNHPFLEKRTFKLSSDYSKTGSLSHFLKANYNGDEVTILSAQSSAMLSSYADTNCIIHLTEAQTSLKAGERVEAYILP